MTNFLEKARQLDKQDPLKDLKKEFYLKEDSYYFDGNSLGLLSKKAESAVFEILQMWKDNQIDGWTEGEYPWFTLSEKLSEQMAQVVGAKKKEVIITGQTTTNLHQLIRSLRPFKDGRTKVIVNELEFPSDIYAISAILEEQGLDPLQHLISVKSKDGYTIATEDIISELKDDVALLLMPSVLYRSGQLLDMKKLTEAAHKKGILAVFDCSHSVGCIPHDFHNCGIDAAFWCTYKYLNGGPGAVAGLFIHEKHLPIKAALAGWFGSDKSKQFDMAHNFTPADEAGSLQSGTPHILSIAPLIGSLSITLEAGIQEIREKSLALTDFLMEIAKELLDFNFEYTTPSLANERGGHISLSHPEAARICKALKAEGVISDFRFQIAFYHSTCTCSIIYFFFRCV
ncbi:kynureninase [Halalkalibacter akibai]|uniref:Kynureninase n=1 Tax=Halalkalibacter akibai (strain ATCC 43226 / DSM 21942 / CIP 109018 / JCM 9157 / 1139) TaxID=1236973 RepID=W4QWQ3_HALA3|nr:kynureninase [Halalkalibacter akibai JCM 9157]